MRYVLLCLLAAALLVAPSALAATGAGAIESSSDGCVPNPEYSPWSDLACCVVDLRIRDPSCWPQ